MEASEVSLILWKKKCENATNYWEAEGRIQKMCPNMGSTKEMIRKTAWGKIQEASNIKKNI